MELLKLWEKGLEHPAIAIAFLFLIYFCGLIFKPNLLKRAAIKLSLKPLIILAAIAAINYIFLLILYTFNGNFFEHIEPNVAAVSWLFKTGKSVYTDSESPFLYSLPYGPMLYIINGFFLNLMGASMSAAKLAGTLSAALSVGFVFYSLKQLVGYRIALLSSAYLTLSFISINKVFLAATFWTRSESLLLTFVSLGLLAVSRKKPLIATLLCAISLGVSLNLKIYSVLYFLPIYALLYCRYGIYYVAASLFGAALVAIAPFLCFPQISLANYLFWISVIGKQGFSLAVFRENVEWIAYLSSPALLAAVYSLFINKPIFHRVIRGNKLYIFAVLFSSIATSMMGSIKGGGMYYLIPLIPLFYYTFALLSPDERLVNLDFLSKNRNKYLSIGLASLVLATFSFTILKAAVNESRLIALSQNYGTPVINDIQKIVKTHPGATIGMGYGQQYELSYYRPFLIFYGNPYLVDSATLMSWQQSGKTIPSKTVKELDRCQTQIWLIPKGDAPFELYNKMTAQQVFDEKFRQTFLNRYQRQEQSGYYDLWVCKKGETQALTEGM